MPDGPDLTGLPMVLGSLMRPWVEAIEMTSIGMGAVVADAAGNTSASLKRRAVLDAEAEAALRQALSASDILAQKLEGKAPAVEERKAAMAALAGLIETLRGSGPSENTRALGLGW